MLERNLAGQAAFLRRHAASPARPETSKSMVEGSGMGLDGSRMGAGMRLLQSMTHQRLQ